MSFGVSSTTTPLSTTQNNGILWGAAAAAAVGAFIAEAQRRRAAEEAARRATERAASSGRYRKIAKAYQASLDNFKAGLIKAGFSADAAAAEKKKAVLGGSIPSIAQTVANKNKVEAIEAKMAREDAAEEAKWLTMQAEEASHVAEVAAQAQVKQSTESETKS